MLPTTLESTFSGNELVASHVCKRKREKDSTQQKSFNNTKTLTLSHKQFEPNCCVVFETDFESFSQKLPGSERAQWDKRVDLELSVYDAPLLAEVTLFLVHRREDPARCAVQVGRVDADVTLRFHEALHNKRAQPAKQPVGASALSSWFGQS